MRNNIQGEENKIEEESFRHRSACRTPAERRQKYLTSGK